MDKIYISENIQFLVKKEKPKTQDEFGELFDVGKGLISNYINGRATPKIETLLKICDKYKLTLDELVRFPLSEKIYREAQIDKLNAMAEPPPGYGFISLKYVELLEKSIDDKEKIIHALEDKLHLH